MASENPQIAAADLPRHKFPIKVEFIRSDNGEVVQTDEIPEAPFVFKVDGGFPEKYGCTAEVRLTFGDGTVVDTRDTA